MAKKSADKATILRDKEAEFRKQNLSRNKILEFLRSYKKEKGDPLNFRDALYLVGSCIDFYYDHLLSLVQIGPYQRVHALMVKYVVGSKINLKNMSAASYYSFQGEAARCLYDLVDGRSRKNISDENLNHIKENFSRYLEVLSAVGMIKAGKSSYELPSFINLLYELIYLTFTDLYLSHHFFKTDEIAKMIHSEVSARGQRKRWKTTNELNREAVKIIYELWENDDHRLHDKISKDVVGQLNRPILVPIIKKLQKKYPNKDFDPNEMEEYTKELRALSRGKVASARTVMGLIFQRALEKGRANDPKKGVRKFKINRNE